MLSTISKTAPVENLWFRVPQPNPAARLRLFCFPYAGGVAAIYRPWVERLAKLVEVCPVQLPGRGWRLGETPFTNVAPLARSVSRAIGPLLDKPFAFFGHSMGAIISFELARQLRDEHGVEPAHLFVSGRRAPQVAKTDECTYKLPEPEFIEELRQLNGTPKEVLEHPELMQLVLPLLRADFEVCQTYRYQPGQPLSCPITAFSGLNDPHLHREHLESWREQTTSSFRLRMFPGDHFYLNANQEMLLQELTRDLHQRVTEVA